jgi:hypothetical protein
MKNEKSIKKNNEREIERKAIITFLEETKDGKYTPIEKKYTNLRVKEERIEVIEEEYIYSIS